MKDLTSFIGLLASDKMILKVTSSVNVGRAYSYRGKSELIQFSEERAARLRAWGYTS